jgi:LAS superfamily LD-carboxypeptidase LdcB
MINMWLFPVFTFLLFGCRSAPVEQTLTNNIQESQIDTTIPLDFIMGKFSPETHPDFVLIPEKFANRKGHYLQKETWQSFQKMAAHAATDSITLTIISSTRNFEVQKTIWEAKWTGERIVEDGQNLAETQPDLTKRALIILRYSSMPSTSRHHWGTDLDINALNNKYFDSGKGLKEYNWLKAHAAAYGFCQPYTQKDMNRPNGYNEEKWHWSFKPLAEKYTLQASLRLQDDMISGFLGSETAKNIKVVDNYILGINQSCL